MYLTDGGEKGGYVNTGSSIDFYLVAHKNNFVAHG